MQDSEFQHLRTAAEEALQRASRAEQAAAQVRARLEVEREEHQRSLASVDSHQQSIQRLQTHVAAFDAHSAAALANTRRLETQAR